MSHSKNHRASQLIRAYRRLSLRKKLVVLISLVAGFVTTVSMLASSLIELGLFRARLLEAYETTARMTASNLEAAVDFRDEHDSNDILSVLSQREFIESAAVYLNDGTTLAEFRRKGLDPSIPLPAQAEQTRIARDYIVVKEPISLRGQVLGQIVLKAELGEQRSFILGRSWVFFLITIVSLGITIALARRFGSHLARPIVELAKTAQRITEHHDFSTRQKRNSDDETGKLVDAFNEMMAEIESRSDALVKAKDTAEASSRAKDDFLSVISHELRTPLNPIIGYVEILFKKAKDAEDRKQLGLVKQYSEYLQSLIDRVIDYSRFERGAVNLNEEPVDYQRLCQDVLNLLQQQATEKNLALSCEHKYADGISEQETTLLTDRVKLQQVVLNLVTNALKFTEKGSITIRTLMTHSETSDALLRIEIRDTGIGINKEDRQIAFKPFSQIDVSLTRQYSGMGLGLAITKKIVEAMGGQIDFESERSVGTTFWIELPVTFSQEIDPEPSSPPSIELKTGDRPKKVLLVDDQLVNLELGESMLTGSGHEVVCANSGIEAIKLATKQRFDLIILDIKMPKMNGYETARELRRLENDEERTPIIAMTAHVTTLGNQQCLEAGMDDFIPKPFNTERLNQIVRKWLTC